MTVDFSDGFANIGARPAHPDLIGSFAPFQIISTSVAQNSSLLRMLADPATGGIVFYDHNDFYWNGVWLPQSPVDAQGLGFAQHPGSSADSAYEQWVSGILGEIEVEYENEYNRLLSLGLNADAAALSAMETAASSVRGFQNFVANGLVVSQPGGGTDLRPEILLSAGDPFAIGNPGAAPQVQLSAASGLSYSHIRTTDAFRDGAAGSNVADEGFFDPVLTNEYAGLVSIFERAQLRGIDLGAVTSDDLADKNYFRLLTNQIDGQGSFEHLAAALFTVSGVLTGTFKFNGRLPENIDELREAITGPSVKAGVLSAVQDLAILKSLSIFFGPQAALTYALYKAPEDIQSAIRILKIYFPDWELIAQLDELAGEIEQFANEFNSIEKINDKFYQFVVSSGLIEFDAPADTAHVIFASDGSVIRASDLSDSIFLVGPGRVSGDAGDDIISLFLPPNDGAANSNGDAQADPGDIHVSGGGGDDVFLVGKTLIENEAGNIDLVFLDGGTGADLAHYGAAAEKLTLQYRGSAEITVVGRDKPQTLNNIETVIASQSHGDILYVQSLDAGDEAPVVIDLAGQEAEGQDIINATELSDGVVVDLRHFDEQFIAAASAFSLARPDIDHATLDGNYAYRALHNTAVVAQIFWARENLPDPQYARDNTRISLKNVEVVDGSQGDDFLFGPDDFESQPESITHPRGAITYNASSEDNADGADGSDGDSSKPKPGNPGNAGVLGWEGDDTIIVGTAPTYVDGGEGDDMIISLQDADSHLFGGAGNDIIISGGERNATPLGGIVNGGAGDDTLFIHASQSQIYGGEGRDIFYFGHNTRIMDAESDEAIFFYGLPITGGTTSRTLAEETHTVPVTLFPWIELGINTIGDLVIEAFGDRQFVANYVGGPGSAEQTAGIYISVQEFESYLYVEGGPSRVFDGYHYLVTLIEWAKTLGEVDPLDPPST